MREDNERLANVANALKQQRDELLAELEELSLYVAYNGDDWVQKKAKAAIASVKEK
jgi:hypothetical protein